MLLHGALACQELYAGLTDGRTSAILSEQNGAMKGSGKMKTRMNGKTVLITGASSGIGRAAALAFAEEGASLALAARKGGGCGA